MSNIIHRISKGVVLDLKIDAEFIYLIAGRKDDEIYREVIRNKLKVKVNEYLQEVGHEIAEEILDKLDRGDKEILYEHH